MRGAELLELPADLYIPPDALEVILEAFAGPLDLLLYLIRRQNLDILDIPIAEITDQYIEYVELMRELRLELAAEYLVMAAMLAEIKSRMLLPRPLPDEDADEDPRAELVQRLLEYERFRQAAVELDTLPRLEREHFTTQAKVPENHARTQLPEIELGQLLAALQAVLARAELNSSHRIERESLSVRERMGWVMQRLEGGDFLPFSALFESLEGRAGIVVTFLALLELIRAQALELVQNAAFSPIHIRLCAAAEIDDDRNADATAA